MASRQKTSEKDMISNNPCPIVDVELAAKLGSEMELEQDVENADALPETVKEYLENGPFEVIPSF